MLLACVIHGHDANSNRWRQPPLTLTLTPTLTLTLIHARAFWSAEACGLSADIDPAKEADDSSGRGCNERMSLCLLSFCLPAQLSCAVRWLPSACVGQAGACYTVELLIEAGALTACIHGSVADAATIRDKFKMGPLAAGRTQERQATQLTSNTGRK